MKKDPISYEKDMAEHLKMKHVCLLFEMRLKVFSESFYFSAIVNLQSYAKYLEQIREIQ